MSILNSGEQGWVLLWRVHEHPGVTWYHMWVHTAWIGLINCRNTRFIENKAKQSEEGDRKIITAELEISVWTLAYPELWPWAQISECPVVFKLEAEISPICRNWRMVIKFWTSTWCFILTTAPCWLIWPWANRTSGCVGLQLFSLRLQKSHK